MKSKSDVLYDIFTYCFLFIVLLIVVYPLYFVIIASVSNPTLVNSGQVILFPRGLNFDGYIRIFQDESIVKGYMNTILYTVVGTAVNLAFTIPAAYTLSRKEFKGRKIIMSFVVFTMFFSGGLIPTFMVVRDVGLYNSMWALILPIAVVPYNLIIAKTFFEATIPDQLIEAAQIDGSNHFKIFFKIILPLSKTLLAILALFYAVGHWNSFFNAFIYLKDSDKYPLQLVLKDILISTQISPEMMEDVEQATKQMEIAGLIQYGVIIVSALPLLILYPFLQKYFVKGITIGAVKG